jgi:uncharacterized membrane protein
MIAFAVGSIVSLVSKQPSYAIVTGYLVFATGFLRLVFEFKSKLYAADEVVRLFRDEDVV